MQSSLHSLCLPQECSYSFEIVMGFLKNLVRHLHEHGKPSCCDGTVLRHDLPKMQCRSESGPVTRSWERLLLIVLMQMWISSVSTSSAPHSQLKSLPNPSSSLSLITKTKSPFLLLFDWSDIPISHRLSVSITKAPSTLWVFLLLKQCSFLQSLPLSVTCSEAWRQWINNGL